MALVCNSIMMLWRSTLLRIILLSESYNLLQAMLAINDLFYLAVPLVASLFYEDVVSWLDIHKNTLYVTFEVYREKWF